MNACVCATGGGDFTISELADPSQDLRYQPLNGWFLATITKVLPTKIVAALVGDYYFVVVWQRCHI
jgi:hypothetical protein|tara:strand:+ start:328 stop:525 length:198 start_codon:yes stop_codon:yes gene_type:complete